jgi:hypothetical protein
MSILVSGSLRGNVIHLNHVSNLRAIRKKSRYNSTEKKMKARGRRRRRRRRRVGVSIPDGRSAVAEVEYVQSHARDVELKPLKAGLHLPWQLLGTGGKRVKIDAVVVAKHEQVRCGASTLHRIAVQELYSLECMARHIEALELIFLRTDIHDIRIKGCLVLIVGGECLVSGCSAESQICVLLADGSAHNLKSLCKIT